MDEKQGKTIIEVQGVKMEVDLRHAKRVEEYRVGDKVKVLAKKYQNDYAVYPGMIVGFEFFKELPTIIVCYLVAEYNNAEIKFLYFNAQTKETEIAHTDDVDMPIEKGDVIKQMDKQITLKEEEARDLQSKKAYFLKYFDKYFELPEEARTN